MALRSMLVRRRRRCQLGIVVRSWRGIIGAGFRAVIVRRVGLMFITSKNASIVARMSSRTYVRFVSSITATSTSIASRSVGTVTMRV